MVPEPHEYLFSTARTCLSTVFSSVDLAHCGCVGTHCTEGRAPRKRLAVKPMLAGILKLGGCSYWAHCSMWSRMEWKQAYCAGTEAGSLSRSVQENMHAEWRSASKHSSVHVVVKMK